MPQQDPRKQTKTYIDTYVRDSAITKDNGVARARWVSMYAWPDYPLILEFRDIANVDGIYLCGEPNSTPLIGHDRSIWGYEEHCPIFIASVDKSGITGTDLKWKMERELRTVCETYPTGSLRRLQRRRGMDRNVGSTVIYITEYVLNYRRDTS